MSGRSTPSIVVAVMLVVSLAACAKKKSASDAADLCNRVLARVDRLDKQVADPSIDCRGLVLAASEGLADAQSMFIAVQKADGDRSEAVSIVNDLRQAIGSWVADGSACDVVEDAAERTARLRAAVEKARTALALGRERLQARCGARGRASEHSLRH